MGAPHLEGHADKGALSGCGQTQQLTAQLHIVAVVLDGNAVGDAVIQREGRSAALHSVAHRVFQLTADVFLGAAQNMLVNAALEPERTPVFFAQGRGMLKNH